MKKLIVLLLTILLITLNTSFIFASDEVKYPDVNYNQATLKLETKDTDNNLVSNISVSIYKVADAKNNNNDLTFEINTNTVNFFETVAGVEFDEYLLNLDNNLTEGFAEKLENYIKEKNITPTTSKTSDENGLIEFHNLELGVYLVKDNGSNSKYYPMSSFLISIPGKNELTGMYTYHVDATPKMEKVELTPPPPVIPPSNPDKEIPDTSLPWKNVTILAICGLTSIIVGAYLVRRERHA